MQSKSILFNIDIPGTIIGAESMLKGTYLSLVGGDVAEDVCAERLLGEAAAGQAPPDLAVLVAVEDAVPELADEGAAPQLPQLQVLEILWLKSGPVNTPLQYYA